MNYRGTTLVGCQKQPTLSNGLIGDWLRNNAALAARTTGPLQDVHPGSSGGNFGRFLPGKGLSLSPRLPVGIPPAYFPPSQPLTGELFILYPK